MSNVAKEPSFIGVGWSFPPQFGNRNRAVQMVSGEADIQQSLAILFATSPGERVMHPNFGCRLKHLVFQPMDIALIEQIKKMIEDAILFFEPRIVLESIEVTPQDYEQGMVKIYLSYRIRGTNTRTNMVFPFYLREGTSLPSFQDDSHTP